MLLSAARDRSGFAGEPSIGAFHRLHHGLRLVDGLLVFGGGDRLCHNTSTRAHRHHPIALVGEANSNAHVHIAGEVEVAQGAAVDAAPNPFQLVNNLAGTDLGSTGECASRQYRTHCVYDVRTFG